MIDLHAHTTASDGSLSPAQLVAHAAEIGLSAVGVTDHDTVDGWEEALAASAGTNVKIVPGVELSTSYPRGRFHLLGYYIRPASPVTATLEKIQVARKNRNGEIFENLRELEMPVEESHVRRISGSKSGQLGRPHFALAMIELGYVQNTQEAFDKYLADGQPAYATKAVLTPQDAIEQIHQSGGVAIWAHPPLNKNFSPDELEAELGRWVDWGLDGIETHYSRYTIEQAAWAEKVRLKFDLLAGGGSDFHGTSKPDVKLGQTQTGAALPDEILQKIKARRDAIRAGKP